MSKVKISQHRRNGRAFGLYASINDGYYVVRYANAAQIESHKEVRTQHQAAKCLRDWLRYFK